MYDDNMRPLLQKYKIKIYTKNLKRKEKIFLLKTQIVHSLKPKKKLKKAVIQLNENDDPLGIFFLNKNIVSIISNKFNVSFCFYTLLFHYFLMQTNKMERTDVLLVIYTE